MSNAAQDQTFLQRHGGTLLLAAVAALFIFAMQSGVFTGTHPLVGKPAPDFTLQTPEKKEVALASHLGKDIVVLDFFATWCPPCRQSLPDLARIATDYEARGVALYTVNVAEDADTVSAYFAENKLNLIAPLDEYGAVAESYGVNGIPQQVIIGKDGVIQWINVGYAPGDGAALRKALDRLLAGENLVKPPAA